MHAQPNYQSVKMMLLSVFLTIISFSAVQSQTKTITGKVSSAEDGEVLSFVNVTIQGTTKGVVTDDAGKYSIDVDGATSVLEFSFVGYETQLVTVGNQVVINVALAASSQRLNEVVVTALGITREEKSLGYSVGKVKGDALRTVSQENVINALAGKVAGVTVNQTSIVGSSTSIVIRGATSLTSDNQPLFIINGVPVQNSLSNMRVMGNRNEVDYGNPISDLNPDDIESVSVLKGPSAAALYGSRAGNGVIIITTKKGKKGEALSVNFSSSNVLKQSLFGLVYCYNILPQHVVNASSVQLFQCKLQGGLLQHADLGAEDWQSLFSTGLRKLQRTVLDELFA